MSGKTVMITGANAGLGLEAATQFARLDAYSTLVLTARSEAKAVAARDQIVSLTGRNAADFELLVFDLVQPDTVEAALAQVERLDLHFDGLVLNAGGLVPSEDGALPQAASGLSKLFAMNVGGHAQLLYGLLAAERIREGGTVVFAGSEASRGIPVMRIEAPGLPEGDLDAAVAAVASGTHVSGGVDDMNEYALVKLLGTAWVADLARHHREVRFLTVSPGMTTGTNAIEGMEGIMKWVMKLVAFPLMTLLGNAHNVSSGAARYVQALEDRSLKSGGFYASPNRGVTGALTSQPADSQPLLADEAFQVAVGRYLRQHFTVPALRAVAG